MYINDLLNNLAAKINNAKKQQFGRGFIIGDKDELIALIEDVRSLLPTVVHEAEEVLNRKEELIRAAKLQAEQILNQAAEHRDQLASNHEVLLKAAAQAEEMRAQVESEVAKMRAEADDYLDKQLARFEVALTKVLSSVRKGREHLLSESKDEDHPRSS